MRVRKAASERNEKKSHAQMLHFSDVQLLFDMRYDITDNGYWILSMPAELLRVGEESGKTV